MMNVGYKLALDQPAAYQIKVPGELDKSWSDWAGGMTITKEHIVQARQVFSTYDLNGQAGPGQFRYCPLCGTELVPGEKGGRQRQACPDCQMERLSIPAMLLQSSKEAVHLYTHGELPKR